MTSVEIDLHIPAKPGQMEQVISVDLQNGFFNPYDGFDLVKIDHGEAPDESAYVTEREVLWKADKRHQPAELPPGQHIRVMSNRRDRAFLDIRHLSLPDRNQIQP